jgi:hypothetical protein
LRRLSKSPGIVLSVVLSIGLGIQVANQAFVDHVSLDKIPLAVASTAAASIIGVVKDIKYAPSMKKPAPYFSALSTRQVGSSGKKSLFQVCRVFLGDFTPPSYPEYTLFVCIRVSSFRVVSHSLDVVLHL